MPKKTQIKQHWWFIVGLISFLVILAIRWYKEKEENKILEKWDKEAQKELMKNSI